MISNNIFFLSVTHDQNKEERTPFFTSFSLTFSVIEHRKNYNVYYQNERDRANIQLFSSLSVSFSSRKSFKIQKMKKPKYSDKIEN
jgi:hypothetical protein